MYEYISSHKPAAWTSRHAIILNKADRDFLDYSGKHSCRYLTQLCSAVVRNVTNHQASKFLKFNNV